MKLSAVRKVARVAEDRARKPRTYFIWWGPDEPRDIVQVRIRAMIASGKARRNDRFITFTWTRTEDDAA